MRPGLANAILLVMIESLADFGNPLLLGGGVPFLPTEIFYAIEGRFDQHEAAAYGLVLLVITLTIFFLQRYWLGRRSYVTVTGKPSGGRPTPLPRAADLVLTERVPALRGRGRAPVRLHPLRKLRQALGHRQHLHPARTTRT